VKAVDTITSIVLAVAWLAVAAVIAIGAAGVVASMNHFPTTPARAELTWPGDQAAGPALDAAGAQLQELSDDVDALGTTARDALTRVVAGDLDGLNQSIATGTSQVGVVKAAAAKLAAAMGAVPGVGGEEALTLSGDTLARYQALAATADLTSGLEGAWAGFSGRALDGASLTGLLARHDQETADAAGEGAGGRYKRALSGLDKSDATIAQARAVRDRLAPSTDVSTLTQWIDRNATYDGALRDLYKSLSESKGRVNDRVRRAFQAEQAARSQLPADTRGMVVIMSDVAQGGLNQAVISIEEARGALASALDLQRRLVASPEPSP
jgi:hypothetical protein